MKNLLGLVFGIAVFLMVFPLVYAIQTLGTFQQDDTIELTQICDNCTYVNLTTIQLPNSTIININTEMTETQTTYNYSFTTTDLLGNYIYTTCGDPDGDFTCQSIDFEITQSGREKLNSGEGMSLFISIVVMLIIGIFFFLISLKFESNAGKIICVGLSGIVFFIAILYSLVILDQTFGGFSTLTESYANFWMVMKVIISVILTFFTLYVFLVIFKWWNIKRGLLDVD